MRSPAIPSPFREALGEVAIVIDDEPTPEQRRDERPGRRRRCSTACTRACRGPSTAPTGSRCPNRITLFRLPLEEDFPDPDDLAEEVRITVIHELAHHLGIDDDRLDELGVD